MTSDLVSKRNPPFHLGRSFRSYREVNKAIDQHRELYGLKLSLRKSVRIEFCGLPVDILRQANFKLKYGQLDYACSIDNGKPGRPGNDERCEQVIKLRLTNDGMNLMVTESHIHEYSETKGYGKAVAPPLPKAKVNGLLENKPPSTSSQPAAQIINQIPNSQNISASILAAASMMSQHTIFSPSNAGFTLLPFPSTLQAPATQFSIPQNFSQSPSQSFTSPVPGQLIIPSFYPSKPPPPTITLDGNNSSSNDRMESDKVFTKKIVTNHKVNSTVDSSKSNKIKHRNSLDSAVASILNKVNSKSVSVEHIPTITLDSVSVKHPPVVVPQNVSLPPIKTLQNHTQPLRTNNSINTNPHMKSSVAARQLKKLKDKLREKKAENAALKSVKIKPMGFLHKKTKPVRPSGNNSAKLSGKLAAIKDKNAKMNIENSVKVLSNNKSAGKIRKHKQKTNIGLPPENPPMEFEQLEELLPLDVELGEYSKQRMAQRILVDLFKTTTQLPMVAFSDALETLGTLTDAYKMKHRVQLSIKRDDDESWASDIFSSLENTLRDSPSPLGENGETAPTSQSNGTEEPSPQTVKVEAVDSDDEPLIKIQNRHSKRERQNNGVAVKKMKV